MVIGLDEQRPRLRAEQTWLPSSAEASPADLVVFIVKNLKSFKGIMSFSGLTQFSVLESPSLLGKVFLMIDTPFLLINSYIHAMFLV